MSKFNQIAAGGIYVLLLFGTYLSGLQIGRMTKIDSCIIDTLPHLFK